MPAVQPIIIRKSLVGFLLIHLIGLTIFAGLAYVALSAGVLTKQPLGIVYGIGAFVVALGTLIQGYVYHQAYIELTDGSLIVTTYSTLFVANTSETLYNDIQDVNIKKPGIIAMLFDTGTLLVNSASGGHLTDADLDASAGALVHLSHATG